MPEINERLDALESRVDSLQETVKLLMRERHIALIKSNSFRPDGTDRIIGLKEEVDGENPGYYCGHCFNSKQILVHLVEYSSVAAIGGENVKCPECLRKYELCHEALR